jgi:hypothetical protein
MTRENDVDAVIRDALAAEDAAAYRSLAEPGLPDMVTALFRGRMRLYGGLFLAMILGCSALAVLCVVRFLSASSVEEMLRWGAGFFVCFIAALNGKSWYWMQMERLALTREIKRVELLVTLLVSQRRAGS